MTLMGISTDSRQKCREGLHSSLFIKVYSSSRMQLLLWTATEPLNYLGGSGCLELLPDSRRDRRLEGALL